MVKEPPFISHPSNRVTIRGQCTIARIYTTRGRGALSQQFEVKKHILKGHVFLVIFP